MKENHILKERIAFTIGLVCGHLKTKKYAAYLSRCCRVHEGEILTVDFRKKVFNEPANQYAFEVIAQKGGQEYSRSIMMQDVWANNWGYNLFMMDACECCDDIFGETADISVGDAWLPEYIGDYRGTSVIICRRKDVLELLTLGVKDREIVLENISVDKVIESQAAGIRQRRGGLQYRLYLAAKKGQWRPKKRVMANRKAISFYHRLIQWLRIKIKSLSHEAFLQQEPIDGLTIFVKKLRLCILTYNLLYKIRSLPSGFLKKLRACFFRIGF